MKLYFIICFILLLALLFLMIFRYIKNKQLNALLMEKKRKNPLFFLYKLYSAIPGINRWFAKLKYQLSQLYPADSITINIRATNMMTQVFGISIIGFLLIIIISQGDLFYIGTGIIGICVITQNYIAQKLHRMEETLLKQFANFLSRLSAQYSIEKPMEDVIANITDSLPYEIKIHILKIQEILETPDSQTAMQEYIRAAPLDCIVNFLAFVIPSGEYGDKQEKDKPSAIKENITDLIEIVNDEILHLEDVNQRFKWQNVFVIGFVIGLKPIQLFMLYLFPEATTFYNGKWGVVSLVFILFVCFTTYNKIVSLKFDKKNVFKTTSVWKRVSDSSFLSFWLGKEINKHYTHHQEMNELLRKSGDQTGPKAFLLKRIIFAVCGFLIAILMFTVIDIRAKEEALIDFAGTFSSSVLPNDEYQEAMEYAAESMTKLYYNKKISEEDRTDLQEKLSTEYSIYNETFANQVIDVVLARCLQYRSVYYKWYYLLVSFLFGFIGFQIPYRSIKFKGALAETTKESEINQFNSLIMMLMNIDGMLLENILEWMNHFSYYYKKPIMECLVTLNQNEQKSLVLLKEADSAFPPWVEFVERLENIENKGIREAFAEIKTQRSFFTRRKNRQIEAQTIKNSNTAWNLTMMAMLLLIFLWILAPMSIFVYNSFQLLKTI